VDVYETGDRYVVTAELPGLPREAIQIELRENELTLRGQRTDPGVPAAAYQQMERPQGPFARSFVFTDPIDADRVAAELANGVLTVTVFKAERPGARRVEVK
jgi:HSP20 family protein